jgi:hypothetical protein
LRSLYFVSCQKVSIILCILLVYFHAHNNPPFVPFPSHINTHRTLPYEFLIINSNFYPPVYAFVFLVACFPQAPPPKPRMHVSSSLHMPNVQTILFVLISSTSSVVQVSWVWCQRQVADTIPLQHNIYGEQSIF